MNEFFKESRIVSFFSRLNENIIEYWFNSATCGAAKKCREFFGKVILKNMSHSVILRSLGKAAKDVTLSDAGSFVVLTTVFNTLAMIFLNKEMDLFSVVARVCFLCMGTGLILAECARNMRLRQKAKKASGSTCEPS